MKAPMRGNINGNTYSSLFSPLVEHAVGFIRKNNVVFPDFTNIIQEKSTQHTVNSYQLQQTIKPKENSYF